MFFCENCGTPLHKGDRFCEECGTPVASNAPVDNKPYGALQDNLFFCENCGAPLHKGDRFCEECGNPVAGNGASDALQDNLFKNSMWRTKWQTAVREAKKNGEATGIILINTHSCACSLKIGMTLSDYILCKRKQGISYYCLDLATEAVCQTCGDSAIESVMKVLHTIYDVAAPDYLLIVGDTASVGAKKWESHVDKDPFVCSDLPYWTMDLESPWEGKTYDFDNAVLTGRIPCSAATGFAEACYYFENYMKLERPADHVVSFGLSAFAWKEVSEDIYRELGDGLLLSPELTVEQFHHVSLAKLNGGKEPNLLYFNLHGSDMENYWYGQRNEAYPRAFSVVGLPQRNGYVIGTEACYGAIQCDQNAQPKSILLEAMKNGCLAFVGSDTMAYGGVRRDKQCYADDIISRFLRGVKEGECFGYALREARKELQNSACPSDIAIKTNAQFALYGDPSSCLVCSKAHRVYVPQRECTRIYVPIPDIRAAVRVSMIKVSIQIEMILSQYIEKYHSDFSGIQPQHYKNQSDDLMQAMYTKHNGSFIQTLKLYYDQHGKVCHECISR